MGDALVFLAIAKGTSREGWELCSPALQSKGDFSHFPALEANYLRVIFEISQTKIAVLLSIVIATNISLIFIKNKK